MDLTYEDQGIVALQTFFKAQVEVCENGVEEIKSILEKLRGMRNDTTCVYVNGKGGSGD